MSELLGSRILLYLGTHDGEYPKDPFERLKRIGAKDDQALQDLFPEVPLKHAKRAFRAEFGARDYYRLGYQLRLCTGFGVDVEGFLDSLVVNEQVTLEAEAFTYVNGLDAVKDDEIYRVGKERIAKPREQKWEMLSEFRRRRWIKECNELNKKYLVGQRVVYTGEIHKMNDKRIRNSIGAMGGVVQDNIDSKTTLVVVGHEPEHSIVDEAFNQNIDLMNEGTFCSLASYADHYGWEYRAFNAGQFTKQSQFVVVQQNYDFSGDFDPEPSGLTIATVCKDHERSKNAVKRLNKEFREEFQDVEGGAALKGKRMFRSLELAEQDAMYLVVDANDSEPRQDSQHWPAQFLLFAETEDKAHKRAIDDLYHRGEQEVSGALESLSEDVSAIRELIALGKGLSYDEENQLLKISGSVDVLVMVKLNLLLKHPLYSVKKVSPVDILELEFHLTIHPG